MVAVYTEPSGSTPLTLKTITGHNPS